MTDQGISSLAYRLLDTIRAVPLVDPYQAPWPDKVTIDGHDVMALLELTREVLRLRDERDDWGVTLLHMDREVELWRRRAKTIRGLLDQANVDLHVQFGAERQARVEASSCP